MPTINTAEKALQAIAICRTYDRETAQQVIGHILETVNDHFPRVVLCGLPDEACRLVLSRDDPSIESAYDALEDIAALLGMVLHCDAWSVAFRPVHEQQTGDWSPPVTKPMPPKYATPDTLLAFVRERARDYTSLYEVLWQWFTESSPAGPLVDDNLVCADVLRQALDAYFEARAKASQAATERERGQ